MAISEKHSETARKNISKAIESGKSVHRGASNGRWRGGLRTKESHQCPGCGKEMFRDGDWTNNDCSNLQAVSKYEHRRIYHNSKSKHFVS